MYDRYCRFLHLTLLMTCLSLSSASLAPKTYFPATSALLKRANCPADTFQCPASLGAIFNDVCCQNGQTCALDSNNNPACCPSGAICTGTAPANPPGSTPTAATSYVSNPYFSFPYAQTTFENSASCASAIGACSKNYEACVTGLGGDNGYPVTIVVPGGGGTTVEATRTDLGAQVTPICSSLSSRACSGLEATKCESFGKESGAIASNPLPPSLTVMVAGTCFMIMLMIGQSP